MNRIGRVLITGISGAGGIYLSEYLQERHPEIEVHGISRKRHVSEKGVKFPDQKSETHLCDLINYDSIFSVIEKINPDAIFHLASDASVKKSFDYPLQTIHNNIIGTANLFEAVRKLEINPIIQLCSTAEVYGLVDKKDIPIREECPARPLSPYAVSKLAQENLAFMYNKNYNEHIIITRLFDYVNPRRKDTFTSSFAMQVARIEAGLQNELLHGNLEPIRTLLDVRDAMESYWMAITKCRPGEIYNIGGDTTISVGGVLDILKRISRLNILSRVSLDLLRPTYTLFQIPDTSKFRAETGWKPRHSFEESMKFLLEYFRTELKE